jgi:hypothetical protein
MQQGTQMAISIVQNLRTIAKAYPGTAPFVEQINDLMRKVMAGMMEHQQPGEPAAPPSAG